MDPYRAPQPIEPPLGDPMKRVLIIVSALALAGAFAVVALEWLAQSREQKAQLSASPVPTTVAHTDQPVISTESEARPPVVAATISSSDATADVVFAYEANSNGDCFGRCQSYRITIDSVGAVRIAAASCRTLSTHASDAELADLRSRALAVHVDRIGSWIGPRMVDVPRFHTVLTTNGRRHDVEHLDVTDMGGGPGYRAVLALHEAIKRVAHFDSWLKTCVDTRPRL